MQPSQLAPGFHVSLFSHEALASNGWSVVHATVPCSVDQEWSLGESLLSWYGANVEDVEEYLDFLELEAPSQHDCEFWMRAKRDPQDCTVFSPSGHRWRSFNCPQFEEVNTTNQLHRRSGDSKEMTVRQSLASPDWRRQHVLDGVKHNYQGYSVWSELPHDIMRLVLAGRATREQLWVVEARLFRFIAIARSYHEAGRFALMWACVHRARRGFQAEFHFFSYLSDAQRWRPTSAEERASVSSHESIGSWSRQDHWNVFFSRMQMSRQAWHYPLDVLTGVIHNDKVIFDEDAAGAVGVDEGEVRQLKARWLRCNQSDRTELRLFVEEWCGVDPLVRIRIRDDFVMHGNYKKGWSLPPCGPLL